jgi:hypothetical protein
MDNDNNRNYATYNQQTNGINPKKAFLLVALIFLLPIAALVYRDVILGGITQTTYNPVPPLAGSISLSLINSGSSNIPQAGKDFKITNTKYFDNKKWVVVSITQLPKMNPATVLLEDINGLYIVVLGPGTLFSPSIAQSLPSDVTKYFINQGLID